MRGFLSSTISINLCPTLHWNVHTVNQPQSLLYAIIWHAPYNPIDHQQCPRSHAHLFAPIDAAPRVHGRQSAHETQSTQVEYCGIANICEATKIAEVERSGDSFVGCWGKVVGNKCITLGGKKMELVTEVFALLRSYLCGLYPVRLNCGLYIGARHLPRAVQ
jgi:hypothetical protein